MTFLVALTLVFTFGCFREYYRANPKDVAEVRTVVEEGEPLKYFIVHQGARSYHLQNLLVSEQAVSADLAPLPANRHMYERTQADKTNRYRGKKERSVLEEAHIWLRPDADVDLVSAFLDSASVTIRTDQVDRIEFYEMDHGATATSYIVSLLGIGVAVGVVAGLIVANYSRKSYFNTESSCPYVYAFDGQTFQLQGELFAGALLPNLERDDYLLLSGQQPLGGRQVVRLRNELEEIQHINSAELIAVNHDPGVRVLMDRAGRAHSIAALQTAREARSAAGKDVLPLLDSMDGVPFLFNESPAEGNALLLRFERPGDVSSARLVLHARNTPWVEMMWYEYNRRFGGVYQPWYSRLGEKPADEMKRWMTDQQLMLEVELLTGEGWRPVDQLPFTGPLAMRDMVVPIDLAAHPGDEVQIRLRSGFLFWELDFAAMDFSAARPLDVAVQALERAPANDGRNYTAALSADDSSYLRQLNVGDEVDLVFPLAPVGEGQVQTLFLRSRGYYEPLRDFSGMPHFLELRKFKEPGHFSVFSQQHYRRFRDQAGIRIAEEGEVC